MNFLKNHVSIFLQLVFVAMCGCSLVAVSGGWSLQGVGISLWWIPLLWSTGCRAHRLQQLWHTGSIAAACGLQIAQAQQLCMGLIAPWHVESSFTRDQTLILCNGRWILTHCTTREHYELSNTHVPPIPPQQVSCVSVLLEIGLQKRHFFQISLQCEYFAIIRDDLCCIQ